ncbi:MAG: tetratricopeptide repeat protein, partial [Rhodospirillales bacterium]|nr:tetratricopeptide repeat protein [Rhodospirillales bacterium]
MGLTCVTAWAGRALAACGISATLLFGAAAFADDVVERVLSLISQEQYAEAREVFEPLLEREPNAPRLRLLQGILEVHEGNPREAVAIFERLRSDYPDMFEPHNNLAVLHAREGRLDAARDALVAALQREHDAVAYANLGDVYMRLADRAYSRAREAGSADGTASERPAAQAKSSVVAAA